MIRGPLIMIVGASVTTPTYNNGRWTTMGSSHATTGSPVLLLLLLAVMCHVLLSITHDADNEDIRQQTMIIPFKFYSIIESQIQ